MATGNYGIVRPADVSPNDMEIFYHYTPSRNLVGNPNLIKIQDPNDVIKRTTHPSNSSELFGGLYNMTLPVGIFGNKGIYTIIIKPVEIRTRITDCGVLSSIPEIKGIVLDSATIPVEFIDKFENNGLIGYRVEYLSTDPTAAEKKIPNLFTIITSSNKAEPVSENLSNSTQKSIRYRFNDSATLIYCTLTPSSSSIVKSNIQPFIGVPNQEIIITNTYFNPVTIEVEVVEHDHETLALALFGNQTKSLEDGIYTVYNFSNQIFRQYNLYEVKDQFTGKPLFEVKEEKSNIDFTKDFNTIINF